MLSLEASPTPRRGFLGRLAAATLALGVGALPERLRAEPADRFAGFDGSDPEHWLDGVKGKHRQVYDAVSPNNGMSLIWSTVFLDSNNQSAGLKDSDLNAVVVLRHEAIPLAFTDGVWQKYKLGEAFGVKDPGTKAPAERNPYFHPHEGELLLPGAAIEKLLDRGVIFGVCNVALTVYSGMRADAIGVSKDAAKAEWLAGLIPGMTVVPAGVWAVNRAQERGCTYCYAG
jgi:intracellular sulfur oxidation DsrE/DsrF family protein